MENFIFSPELRWRSAASKIYNCSVEKHPFYRHFFNENRGFGFATLLEGISPQICFAGTC